jgi:trigger factor
VQVSVDKTGPCEAKVTFSVPRSDFDREYQAALKASGKKLSMKGFRPGKVPVKILEKEFGTQVRVQAIEFFMGKAYDQAVKDNELQPIGHERVDIENIELEEGADLGHCFTISLKPLIELANYKGLEVVDELPPVLDQEIDDAEADLRMQHSTPTALEDGAGLPEDGQAMCNLEWTVDGESLLAREGLRLAPLAALPGVEAENYKAGLTGAKNGDAVEMDLTVPDDFENEEARGKTGTCTVTVLEGFEMQPPADEEIWKLLEVESRDEFQKIARERIGDAKQQQENQRQESILLEKVIESHEFDLPSMMVANQLESRKGQMRQQLTQNGVPEEEHEAKLEENSDQLAADTEKAVRALFLVNAIAEKEELKVEEADMAAEMQSIAARHQAKVEEVVEHYRKNNLFQQVQIELLERKVRVFLRENAKITEP